MNSYLLRFDRAVELVFEKFKRIGALIGDIKEPRIRRQRLSRDSRAQPLVTLEHHLAITFETGVKF